MRHLLICAGMVFVGLSASAFEEQFKILKAGSEIYSKVTVTSVTATHVYFNHSRGIGSAKLADLEPSMQQHFRFDRAKAFDKEAEQVRDNAAYSESVRKAAAAAHQPDAAPAKSFLDQPAPELRVESWLTKVPQTRGKFVLVDIWATACAPCLKSIPHLNELQAKYKEQITVIGLSSEPEQDIRRMTDPKIEFALANDTQRRTSKALEVKDIPHLLLIDPKGIVRFEGQPQALKDEDLEALLVKYQK